MKMKQISIMMENSPGRIYEISEAFADAGVNMYALIVSDTAGFGVIRLLVSDVPRARQVLMEMQAPAKIEEVVAVTISDQAGGLKKVLKHLFEEHVNINYMYAFTRGDGTAVTVFSFSDNDKAIKVMEELGINPSGVSK